MNAPKKAEKKPEITKTSTMKEQFIGAQLDKGGDEKLIKETMINVMGGDI